ncbi:MAG: phosphotransferase family protein [Microthrixaceae bacterium]
MNEMPISAVRSVLERYVGTSVGAIEVRPVAGGNGQETWFVDAKANERVIQVVLRRDPAGGSMEFTDRRVEFDVLRSLEGVGLPIPHAHAYGSAEDGLGRPYLLMERLPGAPPKALDSGQRASLGAQLGALLGRLHDRRDATSSTAVPAADRTRQHVAEWRQRYDGGHLGELPMIDALFGWLELNVPESARPSVQLWGDPGPHNLLVSDGEITGMLDWELAHDGDPLDDLGAAVWACLDTFRPADVIRGYEETSPFPVSRADLDYFVVLACVTRSAISARGAKAFVEGRTSTLHLAGLALSLTSANLVRAAVHAGWGSVDESPESVEHLAPDSDATRSRPDGAELTAGVARVLADHLATAATDRSLRRDLQIAAALLRTATNLDDPLSATANANAELARLAEEVRRRTGTQSLDVSECAHAIEGRVALADLRDELRSVLMGDLACRRARLAPLHELYGDLVAVPRRSPFSEEPHD